jgi:RNA polymerase sigma-70 factor (family 1)
LNPFQDHSDEELLSLIRKDDEQAFTHLFHRYSGKIASLAFSKVHSEEITEEIVQDIFTAIWAKRHELKINTFSSYIFLAVKYQAIDHLRRQIRIKKHGILLKAFIKISEEETLKTVELHDLEEFLQKGISRLPDKTQQVFKLNRFEGKSISEIAVKLNLSEKAIKYHISKSLKGLRLHLRHFLMTLIL